MSTNVMTYRGRTRPVFGLGIAVLSLAGGGCATTGPARTGAAVQLWLDEGFAGRRITTAHFEILSTVRDAEFEAGLPEFVEAAFDRYAATLPAAGRPRTRLTMYVFGSRSEWIRFTRRRFPARFPIYSRIRTGGFTEGDVSVSFYADRAATLATLAHEGWHQYVRACCDSPIPAWLNEGLACRHEAVQYVDERPQFTPRHNSFRMNTLREAIQNDTMMSLTRLVAADAGEVMSREHLGMVDTYYAQAWALVIFLQHGAGGRYAGDFARLVRDIGDDTLRVRLSAARATAADTARLSLGELVFKTYFGAPPAAFEEEYFDYLIRITGL